MCLADSKHDGYDIVRRVAKLPQMCHDLVGGVDVCVDTVLQHLLHKQGVGLIANLCQITRVAVSPTSVLGSFPFQKILIFQ